MKILMIWIIAEFSSLVWRPRQGVVSNVLLALSVFFWLGIPANQQLKILEVIFCNYP